MASWKIPCIICAIVLTFTHQAFAFTKPRSNLCKWCENSSPVCVANVCYSNCTFNSFCENKEEICVAIWKHNGEGISVSTSCHHPHLPVENVTVPYYNTSECVMSQQANADGVFYICGCTDEQDCNDKLTFKTEHKVFQSVINRKTNLCKWCEQSIPVCEDNVCHTNCTFGTYCENSEDICVALWKQVNNSISVRTLCHNPQFPLMNIMVPKRRDSRCVMAKQHTEDGFVYVCGCVEGQECNDKLIFEIDPDDYATLQSKEVIPVALLSLLPPVLVTATAIISFYLYRTRRQRKLNSNWSQKKSMNEPLTVSENGKEGGYEGKLLGMADDIRSDISSACANSLNHNTEPLPIELTEKIRKGRFAEVWQAKLKHCSSGRYENVAIKIFPHEEYASWKNERKIFLDANLKHDCVLQFLAAEERGKGVQKQYWLITAYHSLGNLQDYLTHHILSWTQLHAMASSVVNGVAHLHSDCTNCGTPKIPIAHRDIKSTNILIKNERECVLCDFGLALRLDPSLTVDDYANSGQVGTARYMAPEVLESRVNLEDVESFKQIDVYSMALVLWEMASRCEATGGVKSYELPFSSKFQEHPSMESIRDIVLRDRCRPEIPKNWLEHKGMHFLCDTIIECWDHDPEARLTSHCVAERFSLMAQMDCEDLINNNTEKEDSTVGLPTADGVTDRHGNIQLVTEV
ncbi:TGF-beta receptor type-2-like [Protopterus annectens]|uniref:TGF-beta receptor type-2-like n=1 Tax=Protopterus annectens TaxID=7888 RepID=UPI001CF97046|nr:TGF-beta receptor type-2-like [Protopterus annectens]